MTSDERPEPTEDDGQPQPVPGETGRPRPRDDTPVLPPSTRDDTDSGWGERPADNDSWLREQRPPHWD